MIKQRVKYYKEKTKTSDDSPFWLTILKMLDTYEQIIVDRDVYGKDKIADELNPILDIINNRIGRMLYAYYYQLIGSAGRDITVLDVVTYELSQNYSIKYNYFQNIIIFHYKLHPQIYFYIRQSLITFLLLDLK